VNSSQHIRSTSRRNVIHLRSPHPMTYNTIFHPDKRPSSRRTNPNSPPPTRPTHRSSLPTQTLPKRSRTRTPLSHNYHRHLHLYTPNMAYSLAYTNLSSHYLGTFDVLRDQSRLGTCAQTREQVNRISEVLLLGIRLCAAQLGTPKQINDLVDTRMYEIMTEDAAFEPVPAELCSKAGAVGADLGAEMAALRISSGSGEEENKFDKPKALPWPGNTPATAHKPTSGFSSSSSEEVHSSSTMRDWAGLIQDRSIVPSGLEPKTYVFKNWTYTKTIRPLTSDILDTWCIRRWRRWFGHLARRRLKMWRMRMGAGWSRKCRILIGRSDLVCWVGYRLGKDCCMCIIRRGGNGPRSRIRSWGELHGCITFTAREAKDICSGHEHDE
jgi:hypothetical protein